MSSTFDMDWNLYYNPDLALAEVEFNGLNSEQWQDAGKDQHSVYADPCFVDPVNKDFRLRKESSALALGFRPIDVSKVGPRQALE